MGLVIRRFTFTGSTQTFSVPPLVEYLTIKAWGAGGGNSGGAGGYASGNLNVVESQSFQIIVGQGGILGSTVATYGGGGAAGTNSFDSFRGSSGGGRCSIFTSTLVHLITAGGGGGGSSTGASFTNGGPGGGLTGIDAFGTNTPQANQGKGGTQVAGGAGGTNSAGSSVNGNAGIQWRGGQGGISGNINCGSGGGGGGGLFGGGGGAGQFSAPTSQDSAAGGGSSFLGPVLGGVTQNTPQNTSSSPPISAYLPPNTSDVAYSTGLGVGGSTGGNGGNGLVAITYTLPDLTLIKTVDKAFADIGDTLDYTIAVRNLGTVTVPNVIFVDTVPSNVVFLSNSLKVDGITIAGTANPPGITIPSIGINTISTVTFSVIVVTIPSPNSIQNIATASYSSATTSYSSNTVSTVINHIDSSSSKVVNKIFANVGDILTYTIPILVSGNVTAINVIFQDTIPNDTTLVPGSFVQDGSPITGSPNPPGISLNNIRANTTSTVVFKVQVQTIPCPNPILNAATIFLTYTIDSSTAPNRRATVSNNTNIVSTQVNNANLANIKKLTDKDFATCGNQINYTIIIPNTGNVTAQNIFFKDTIPNGTNFVTNSVLINNVPQIGANPQTGISLPNIAPGSTVTIIFSVKVQC